MGEKIDRLEKTGIQGHYFVACYLRNIVGQYNWILIDSDRNVRDIRDIRLSLLNLENRNIDRNYYAFAYVRDYSDVIYNGIKIDSIENMAKIQISSYKQCDINDLTYEEELEK